MIGMALAFILLLQEPPAPNSGIVSGQLQTLEGSPAVSFRVAAIPAPAATVRPSDGANYYYTQPPVSTAMTDSQGRYRLINVPAGRYFIVSGTTYFPTTIDADRATVVTVTANSRADNLNFKLMTAFGGKVSGRINPKPDANTREKAILSGVNFDGLLEIPIAADGTFEFGHVPRGSYFIDIIPTPPGMGASRVQVSDGDVSGVEIQRPKTHSVTGKIVVQNGPLPRAQVAFFTPKSYVSSTIKPDLTFTLRLHEARHQIDVAGMPVGYSVVSVRKGSEDVTKGLQVVNADVPDLVITVAAPAQLPRVRGQISGLAGDRMASTKIELTGPIIGSMETTARPDGSFEFGPATPGMYRLRLPQVPELTPMNVVVTWNDAQVPVVVPGR